mmetsp:Transcript_13847/g.39805  ORF Transcript_13847/g.39805 Transcript_13847/m.39805 type:complete len:225 (-) Transcript_13847:1211-1885(-)
MTGFAGTMLFSSLLRLLIETAYRRIARIHFFPSCVPPVRKFGTPNLRLFRKPELKNRVHGSKFCNTSHAHQASKDNNDQHHQRRRRHRAAAAAAKRSPTTIEIALRIVSHPFPTSTGTDGNDDGPSRGPGDPNSYPFLVLPGTEATSPTFLWKSSSFFSTCTKRGPFSRMDACEQLGVLSRKRDNLIEALESAGDGGREVAESITNVLTSLGSSIPTFRQRFKS